jgi:hypothetical protein
MLRLGALQVSCWQVDANLALHSCRYLKRAKDIILASIRQSNCVEQLSGCRKQDWYVTKFKSV